MLDDVYKSAVADVLSCLDAGICTTDGLPIRVPLSMVDFDSLLHVLGLRVEDRYREWRHLATS